MLWPRLHQYQTHATRPSRQPLSKVQNDMRHVRLYLVFTLVILASCDQPVTNDGATNPKEEKQIGTLERLEQSRLEAEENYTITEDDPLITDNDQLPILPPIILLDFANDLENATSSGDDKSKRTIDSNLGYGFGRNNLFTGKYNYYFPAGKSGTTVSIEESITPFLPKTIIETVKPITEKPYAEEGTNAHGQNPLRQYNFPSTQQGNRQTVHSLNNRYVGSQPIYGQRTKLYKPSQIDFSSYPGYSSTPKSTVETYTTARPDYRSNSYGSSQNNYATAKPGAQSGSYNFGYSQSAQTSQRPFSGFSTPAPPAYVTPTASSYQTRYNPNGANGYSTPRPPFDGITTPRPPNSDSQTYALGSPLTSFANLPRFTVENGVRYENKIVWKYPDGKISHTPPTSYVNAYNEFLTKQKPGIGGPATGYQNEGAGGTFSGSGSSGNLPNSGSGGNFQNSGSSYPSAGPSAAYQNSASPTSFQNPNYQSHVIRYQTPQASHYPAESISNIYSKSPAQFPKDQELNKPARPSQFVSSASLLSNANYAIGSRPQGTHGQSYSYQGQFGQKNPTRTGISSVAGPSSGPSYQALFREPVQTVKDSYGSTTYEDQRPVPKYAVNSPNPEYTYSTEPSVKSTTPTSSSALFTPSGTLSPNVLSKYSSQAQKYLTKVFASGSSAATSSVSSSGKYGATGSPQVNTNYESLLNYNPSISQYIRDPSSILNAQPTFIQAGNSLIPVIILRVDGAPPIQPKTSAPNINLKALLQQYLTQYAGSLGHKAHYDIGNGGDYGKIPGAASAPSPHSPLYELTQLAQSLTKYSQDPSIVNNLAKQFEGTLNQSPYETSNSYLTSGTSYEATDKSVDADGLGKYGARTHSKPQKVKSVQIIEDPRFTSYKVNS